MLGGFLRGNRIEIVLDGSARRFGRIQFQDRFKLGLGARRIAELVIGARHIQARTGFDLESLIFCFAIGGIAHRLIAF